VGESDWKVKDYLNEWENELKISRFKSDWKVKDYLNESENE